MDEVPDEWQPPSDLEAPTPYPETNLAIRILSCEYIGHDVTAVFGRFVTEHALFTIWFINEVEPTEPTAQEVILLGNFQAEQTRLAYEAWKAFDRISDLGEPNETLRDRRTFASAILVEVLNNSAATLARYRQQR